VKTFDVAIVGCGVIGASIAFELAGERLCVAVFDRQEPGREASWAAAGMLSPAPDSPRDLALAPLGRESLRIYPDFVASVEEASRTSAQLTREGTLEVFVGANATQDRDRRVETCRKVGIAVESIGAESALGLEPTAAGDGARAFAWFPEEGTVEPRSLTAAVTAAAETRSAELHASCPVTGLLLEGNRCTGVAAGGDKFSAGHVVFAAGCFASQIAEESEILAKYAPTHPVRGQMIALRPNGPLPRHVLRSERGYLVPRRDGRVVAGSTSERVGFEKRVTAAGMRKIFNAALELCPAPADAEVVETWSGLRPGTPDDLPILGPTDIDGLLIATGHYRNGILLAPVTAKLIREWIVNGRTEFDAAAFSPLRFSRQKLGAAVET